MTCHQRVWHTRETCSKLNGKPSNWKTKSGNQSRAFQASNYDQEISLTSEQLDKLFKYFSNSLFMYE
jgi:hypothetical protein